MSKKHRYYSRKSKSYLFPIMDIQRNESRLEIKVDGDEEISKKLTNVAL